MPAVPERGFQAAVDCDAAVVESVGIAVFCGTLPVVLAETVQLAVAVPDPLAFAATTMNAWLPTARPERLTAAAVQGV